MKLPKMLRDVEFVDGPCDGKVFSFGVDSPILEHGWRIAIPIASAVPRIAYAEEDELQSMVPQRSFPKAVYMVAAGNYHNSPMVARFEELAE